MKTLELLEAVKTRYNLPSDYAAAKLLPVGKAAVSAWRSKSVVMDDDCGLVVAKLLELDPGQVFAWLHAERSKSHQAKQVWNGIARRLGTLASVGFLAVILAAGAPRVADAEVLPGYTLYAVALVPTLLCWLLIWINTPSRPGADRHPNKNQ